MKTVYIAKAHIPSNSANSIHIMKISEAFSKMCEDFQLIVPEPENGKSDIEKSFEYYGVNSFNIEVVKTAKTGIKNRYLFPIKCMWKARKADRVITRDPIVAFIGVMLHKHTVLDLHGDLRHLCGRAYRMMHMKSFRDSAYLHLVTITANLAAYYRDRYNLDEQILTVLPDGYTSENFSNVEFRGILNEKEIKIGYCGGFMKGKGLKLIQQLASEDFSNQYSLYGGTKEKAENEVQGKFSENVTFGGYVPNALVPEILNKQDILLLPNQEQQICKNEDIGKVTSPLKMFEYMASGRVVVASDLSVLREILDESNCYFADAEDALSWKAVIDYIGKNREEAIQKAQKAMEDVKQYTWDNRAKKMLELMKM